MLDNTCGFCWPLLDPNEEDRANNNQHHCVLDYTHALPHRCLCGEEHPRIAPGGTEVLPDAMTWSPNDSLSRMEPFGWSWMGVLHLLPGKTLEDAQGPGWEFMGQIVDSEGNVLQEAREIEDD